MIGLAMVLTRGIEPGVDVKNLRPMIIIYLKVDSIESFICLRGCKY